jgi:hypothetical protein
MCRRGLFIVTTLTQEEGARKVGAHRRQQVPPSQSMIPKGGNRFSDKDHAQQEGVMAIRRSVDTP